MVTEGFKTVCLLIERQMLTYEQAYAILADMFRGIGEKEPAHADNVCLLKD